MTLFLQHLGPPQCSVHHLVALLHQRQEVLAQRRHSALAVEDLAPLLTQGDSEQLLTPEDSEQLLTPEDLEQLLIAEDLAPLLTAVEDSAQLLTAVDLAPLLIAVDLAPLLTAVDLEQLLTPVVDLQRKITHILSYNLLFCIFVLVTIIYVFVAAVKIIE